MVIGTSVLIPHSGIGRFAIYDEAEVNEADLGVNFFLDEDCLGKSRAESLTRLIRELNLDVQGSWYPNESEVWVMSCSQLCGDVMLT